MESSIEIPASFFEQHPQPLLIYDSDTLEIEEANKSAVQKYGLSKKEFSQLNIKDIRSPRDIPKLYHRLKNREPDSAVSKLGTFSHRTQKDQTLHLQITDQYLAKREKNLRILHMHDITDIVESAIQKGENYHNRQKLLYNNPLAIVKYDEHFRIIEWSKRAEEQIGYSREKVLGSSIFEMDLFTGGETDKVKNRLKELSGDKSRDRFQTSIRLKNEEQKEVLIHATALHDRQGNIESVLAFIQNMNSQKQYDQQLKKRERKFHRLYEDANDAILTMHNLTIIDCNDRLLEIMGARNKKNIIGKSPLDFSPTRQPDGRLSEKKAREYIERVKQGEPQLLEWEYHTLDGQVKNTEASIDKIELEGGIYILVVFRDKSEHQKVKNQLAAERKRLKRAQQLAGLGWWSYEVPENQVVLSDILYDILDLNKEEFDSTFEAFIKLIHSEDRQKVDKVMEKARHTPEPIEFMLRIKKSKNEEVLHAQCRVQGQSNDKGELIHLSGVMQDVTDYQKAQEELKRRKELFESLFLDSPVAIAMMDVEGNVQKVNSSFEELFGYQEEELLGKNLLKHQLPEEQHDEIPESYEHLFADNPSSKYKEERRITKAGEVKNLLVGSLPVLIDDEIIAAFDIYTDISKLRRIEKDLQNSLNEKKILLAEIHHRVKNNLAVISGLLELEAMNWDKESSVYKVLTESKLRIHSMASIHEKLYQSKDFANISLENYISDLVETIYKSMHGQKKDVEIAMICDDVTLNINQAVSCALIINELVTNAFKYAFKTEHPGELEVKFTEQQGMVTIVIGDNGPGLPADFEVMAEESLGHELISQLVKQLEGEINVKSSSDFGTRYEIRFEKRKKSGASSNYFM